MEESLAKIRPHTSSSLAHQKTPATLLHALEATFTEQGTERTPTAYYAALLTTLGGTIEKEKASGLALGDGDVLPAELYLLSLVTPFVPSPVLRAHLDTLISLTAPLFPALHAHAPPLRSQLSLYGAVLPILDRTQLETPGVRQSFASILQRTLDARPKVRRRAGEVVRDILETPPAPMLRHPYADRVAEWVSTALAEAAANPLARSKGKKVNSDASDTAIHLISLLRLVLLKLPPTSLPSIITTLLSLPRLGNPYLSQSAYSVLSELLTITPDEADEGIFTQTSSILKAVLTSLPSKSDNTVAPAWLLLLGHAMAAYARHDSAGYSADLGKVWKVVWSFLDNGDGSIRRAAAETLSKLSADFTPALIDAALKERGQGGEPKSVVGKIVAQAEAALDAISFAQAMSELLSVITALITRLGKKSEGAKETPAKVLMMPTIHKIAHLRVQKGFEFKEAADGVLHTAMYTLGPAVLLEELPLNIEPADRQAGKEPRAFLLPMLDHPHPSPLSHFLNYFVPLSERMFEYQSAAEVAGRAAEAKLWSVLTAQVWTGLAGYCHRTPDLPQALTPEFAQMLTQILYGQEELRMKVLKALKALVQSNVLGENAGAWVSEREVANKNLEFLRTQAESWLAVLFNVFGSVDRDARGPVGEVISAWASITQEADIAKAYQNVVALFKQNLTATRSAGPETQGSVASTTQDLLLLLLPFLSPANSQSLFDLCLSTEVLSSSDNAVQKRGYKLLARLVESGRVRLGDVGALLAKLDESAEGLSAAAKRDRFALLALVVARIAPTELHLIPTIIPEAVLGTKEPSEKARMEAFELIVAMGKKMQEGGVVKRTMMDEMDEDDEEGEAAATLEEYVTMVAGGLAGATPHMISASITALSRIVFEFKDKISETMHTEILTTLLVFLTSANREIVKSTLGYVKLSIHTLPLELLRPHLPQLVPALLRWSHDHKNHFKAKVRHVFERMIRRFGFEEVYACAGEEEAKKVLVNIKKRKERAKRKRAAAEEGSDNEERTAARPVTGDAFEDVLYGSESEIEDSDEEAAPIQQKTSIGKKIPQGGARLRADDDEPMDLLHGAATGVTTMRGDRRRKPGQDANRFKMDEDTGKMVIDSDDDSDNGTGGPKRTIMPGTEDVEGNAYRESLTSTDGFTRGPNGRVKFNKDTKKRRRENDEAEDIEMGESAPLSAKKAKKKLEAPKLGHEFKAKKAGGDVKKGGMDPYAYLSLSQAAKKKGGKNGRIGIAGKR